RGEQEGRFEPVSHSPCDPPQPSSLKLRLIRGENSDKVPLFKGDLGGSLSAAILEKLRNNAENNLLTVLIFDQFEEFFFVCSDQAKRRPFYEFLRVCLDIPFVKVILSLREDYLHYLLELERLLNLTVINNNILDKGIRYYLGNFSPEDAQSVVQSLTKNSQFPLETGLIHAFVQDLAGEVGEVRPIELQIVGMQLQTEKITKLEQYQQGWTKNKLVERFLEDVIHDCGAENERTARLVLYLLTNENGTRPLKTRPELAAELGAEANPLDLVLEIFVKSGLVLLLPEKPEYLYQLVHDYLVEFIRQQQGAELLAELKQAKEQQQRSEKRLNLFFRVGLGVAIPAAFGFAVLAWQADYQRKQAEKLQVGQSETLTRYSEELFNQGKDFEALLAGLQAGIPLKRVGKAKVDGLTQVQLANILWQALRGKIATLRGHDSSVNSVSFSPDGKTLASGSGDKTIKLWEVATGKLLTTLTGHDSPVSSVSFSPDGKTLASGSVDKTIKLWDVATGKPLTTLTGHNLYVSSVSFSPDGKTIASGSHDKTIKLWDVATGQILTTLTGHNLYVSSVSFSPDGKTLASGSGDKTIKLWEVATGKLLTTLTGHDSPVSSVSFSPDGKTLASASADIKLWDVATGKLLSTLNGYGSLSFSPDGKTLASGSGDKTIKLWDVATGKPLTTLTGHNSFIISFSFSVSFSPDGKTLASARGDKTIKLWDVATGKLLSTGHDSSVFSVSFSPVRKAFSEGVVTATAFTIHDNSFLLLETQIGEPLSSLKGHDLVVNSIGFSPDGKTLASGSSDGTIKLWEVATGKLLSTLTGHDSSVFSVCFSPDGKTLASGSSDGTIKLWEVATGKALTTLTGHGSSVFSVSFSSDGKTLASGSADKTIKLWEVATGKLLTTLTGHNSSVISVSFSPDGKTLASGSADKTIKRWEVATGKLLTTLTGHNSSVISVSFSPDGTTLASAASADNTIKLWDVATGKLLTTLTEHNSYIGTSVSFSPDGKTLASGSAGKTIKLWKLDLDFDNLLVRGCDWGREYLENSPNVSDRTLCDGIPTQTQK
ncbi:MAG: WD40 repeat domain-containing protein, partial [Cyanobacteriota bacterium]